MLMAENIKDDDLRQSYLENVRENREIFKAAKVANSGDAGAGDCGGHPHMSDIGTGSGNVALPDKQSMPRSEEMA